MKLYEGTEGIEFTTNIAGPTGGTVVAANTVRRLSTSKVPPSSVTTAEHIRHWSNGISIKYCTLNHGKKSVILDLKDPDGNKIARELCATPDIVLESTRPGVRMDRLGLGYEGYVHELNPRTDFARSSRHGAGARPLALPALVMTSLRRVHPVLCINLVTKKRAPVKIFTETAIVRQGFKQASPVNAAQHYRERNPAWGKDVDISGQSPGI